MAAIPKYARYRRVQERLIRLFQREKINTYPIEPTAIMSRNNWAIVKYSQLAKDHNIETKDIVKTPLGPDGWTMYDRAIKNYTIAYNDTRSPRRIRFTLLHEIGHIYLGHFIEFENIQLMRNSLTESEYRVLENEANAFARNALIPALLYDRYIDLHENDTVLVGTLFRASSDAAKTRQALLSSDKETAQGLRYPDLAIEFPVSVPCYTCGCPLWSDLNEKYCPICGNEVKEGVRTMRYEDGYLTDDKNRVKICPKCSNDITYEHGNYCAICGFHLVNQCIVEIDNYGNGCGREAAGNARYCIYCGETTTFYEDGFLKSYTDYDGKNPRTLQTRPALVEPIPVIEPDSSEIDDEELPF